MAITIGDGRIQVLSGHLPGRIVRWCRKLAGRKWVVFRHLATRNVILARVEGRVLVELFIFKQWPRVTTEDWNDIRRIICINNLSRRDDMAQIAETLARQREPFIAAGVRERDFWRAIGRKKTIHKRDLPIYHPPKVSTD